MWNFKIRKPNKGLEAAKAVINLMENGPKKFKNPSPRIKVIQKIYNALMNPNSEIHYNKNQYKKFIKDVVTGTLERSEMIEDTVNKHLIKDINLKKLINY